MFEMALVEAFGGFFPKFFVSARFAVVKLELKSSYFSSVVNIFKMLKA